MSFSTHAAASQCDDDRRALRRQAEDELALAIGSYSGRKADAGSTQLYAFARPIASYVAHGLLSECEVRARFLDAARDKGDIERYGAPWAVVTVRSAFVAANGDPTPRLRPEYRQEDAHA